MSTEQEDVLDAIEEHTKAVDTSLGGMKATIAKLEKQLEAEVDFREVLEKKFNLARFGGPPSDPNAPNPRDLFVRGLKAAYPQRQGIENVDYDEYRKAFSTYLRGGERALTADEGKAMQVGIDTDGGYLAPSELVREMIRAENANSVMRGIARVLPMGAGDLDFPASLTRPAVGWVGETQGRPATSTPTIGGVKFTAKELYAAPEVTQKLIDDSVFDIEQFLGEEIGIAIGAEEDAQFIAGDGILKPHGFTQYPTAATSDAAGTRPWGTIQHIATGQAGAWPTTTPLIYDKLTDVVQALRPRYRQGAAWVMGTEAITKLRKMKTSTTDEPIWQPGMQEGQPDRLLGYVVKEAEQMPAIGANSLSVAFGNWQRGYWILDRLGVRVLRDPYTNKPYVIFYTTKRTTGGIVDSNAIKLLKFAAA